MCTRLIVVCAVLLSFAFTPARADSWLFVGPSAGSVFNVAIHPANPQIILLAGYLNGSNQTYRTTDGGATVSTLPFVAYEMFFDPVTSNTAYALAGPIYRSMDSGATWSQLSTFQAYEMAVAPGSANRLYAGNTLPNGFHTSSNGGTSWSPVTPFGTWAGVSAVAVHPTNASLVFVGTSGNWDVPGEGLFKSTNAGASWTNISPPILAGNVTSLAIDPANPAVMYCATSGSGMYGGNGILKSIDGGATWSQSGFADASVDEVLIDPLQPGRLYALEDATIHVSDDAASSWNPVGTPCNGCVSDIDLHRADTDVICASSGSGVLVSDDAGATFGSFGVEPVDIDAVLVDRSDSSVLVGTGRGRYRTVDGATSWQMAGTSTFGMAIVQDPIDPAILYNGAYSSGGVEKSVDGGVTWTPSLPGKYINDVVIAPSNPSVLYSGGLSGVGIGGIFKTTNAGANWVTLSTAYGQTKSIAVDPSSDAVVYVGGSTGLVKSIDGGASFSPIENGLNRPASGWVQEIVVDPVDPQVLYCGTQFQGVFKSTDGGAQWTRMTNFAADVRGIEIDPVDRQVIYASGGYVSPDGGVTWTLLGGAFSGGVDVTVDPNNRDIIYSAGGGVRRYVRTTTCAVPAIASHQPGVVYLPGCESGCTVTFDVNTGDDYSTAVVVAIERRQGDVWVQEDDILAPLPAPVWQFSRTFQSTDEPGDYVYRAVIRGPDGSRAVSEEVTVSVVSDLTPVPDSPALSFDLEQNHPNPFNPSTTIGFQLPASAHARLAVYDVSGALVAVLADRIFPAGRNEVAWNGVGSGGAAVASGMYFYRLTTSEGTLTRRMVLLK
jgi:photosystem II stability/assembly factor-like uncharacterized protein